MKEKNMKSKKRKKWEFAISLFFSTAIIGGVPTIMNLAELQKYNGVDLTLMSTNMFGVPYTIKSPNEVISVAISDYFTTDEKTKIIKAVNDLDILAEGLNFNYEITNNASSKKIVINNDWDEATSSEATKVLAETHTNRNCLDAKIMFPAIINVGYNGYSKLEEIIKHELLHTLGFKDIKDTSLRRQTIMFWNIDENANDYTEMDIETLNAIYPKTENQNGQSNAQSNNKQNNEESNDLSM